AGGWTGHQPDSWSAITELCWSAIMGLNLFQSAFTKWCPMMWLLGKLGLKG
ncbi:MAG: DUF2892 domain-containing protein, partial [Deltaproteobacteria bacterium]|nr:DUF2892 domain-containing protein [Deltaproteobacteria bacterium]